MSKHNEKYYSVVPPSGIVIHVTITVIYLKEKNVYDSNLTKCGQKTTLA